MSNISKSIISSLEEKFFHTLGNISEKVVDNSMSACLLAFVYEPDLPQELIQNMKEED